MTNLDSIFKNRDITLPSKVHLVKAVVFPVVQWMWELDYKESWALKNWCFWIVLEKTLENPLDCKEIQPVHPKGDQSWVFIGRTDIEAETLILWPPDAKNWLIWKDKWQPTPVLLPGESHRGRSLVDRLQSMRSQRVRHDWETELNWTEPWFSSKEKHKEG